MRGKGGLLMLVFGSSKILQIFGIYFCIGLKGTRVASLPSEMRGSSPFDFAQGQNGDVKQTTARSRFLRVAAE
jgi:hypothetical protein